MLFCVNGSLFLCVNFSRLFPIHQLNDRAWPRIFYSQRQNAISRPQFLQVAWRGANAPQIRNCGLEAQLRDGLERCHKIVQVRIISIDLSLSCAPMSLPSTTHCHRQCRCHLRYPFSSATKNCLYYFCNEQLQIFNVDHLPTSSNIPLKIFLFECSSHIFLKPSMTAASHIRCLLHQPFSPSIANNKNII